MTVEKILIYQPEDIDRYAKAAEGIEQFLNRVTETKILELGQQFRWFAYLRPSVAGNQWHYAGLIYLRDVNNKLDPLAQIDGRSMVEGFGKMATEDLGAKILSAEFGHGRMEMDAHILEDLQRVLGWALAPSHADYGLPSPDEINRFILNLVPEAKDRIIAAFLESKGYQGRFQFVTLKENPQSPMVDPRN